MKDKKKNGWIKFVPSLDLPKERVSIAYDTHDERGVRYAYGYFQFYNGICGCFWKDGNEQPKVVKAEDIKYCMPIPSLDVQEEPVSEDVWEISKQYALRQVLASTDTEMSEQAYLDLRLFSGLELAVAHKDGANWQKEQMIKRAIKATVHPEDGEIWVDNVSDLAPFGEYEEVKVIILKKDEL